MDELLEQLIDQCRPYASEGRLASYIPELTIMRCDSDSGKKLIKSMVLRTADRQGMC